MKRRTMQVCMWGRPSHLPREIQMSCGVGDIADRNFEGLFATWCGILETWSPPLFFAPPFSFFFPHLYFFFSWAVFPIRELYRIHGLSMLHRIGCVGYIAVRDPLVAVHS